MIKGQSAENDIYIYMMHVDRNIEGAKWLSQFS